jgi:endonuclease/exonuclease/phosphatase family metal-dependent hydrolase
MRGLTKSFTGTFKIERFRARLAYPQLAFLKRRIASLTVDRARRRGEIGERLGQALDGVRRFGASGLNHTHWIFPITVADPEAVIKALAEDGISAMRGLSNLTVIEDGSDNRTPIARSALAGSLLVPLPPTPDDDHIRRVARAVRSVDIRDRNRLRVATVNLWSGLDYQGLLYCGSYERKAERERRYQHLVERLLALDADVITVNEANPVSRMMRRLARDLNYEEIHWRGLSGVRLGPIGLPFNLDEGDGILARRHLNLVPVGRVRLTGGWISRWGSLNFANATQVVCGRINVNGQPVHVFNTHWTIARTAAAYAVQATRRDAALSSFFETTRVKANKAYREASTIRLVEAERTVAAIQAMLPPGSRAVLAGDFNAVPMSPEIRAIEDAGFIDVVSRLSPYAKASTWNPTKNDVIQKFYSHSSREDAVRVDYIFANQMVVPALQRVSVGLDGPSDRPHPSDHFALVCDLRLDRIRVMNTRSESARMAYECQLR